MHEKLNFKWYIFVLLIVSYLWQLLIYFTGGVDSKLFPFTMLFPAIIAVIFILVNKEGFKNIGWGLKKWWYIFPAFFIPVAITLITIFILIIMGWASWTNEVFAFNNGTVDVLKVKLILGKGVQSLSFFVLNLLLTLLIQSIPGSIFTLGEEIGWRGYLQKKLTDRYGIKFGLLLLGLIWGYWHFPIILMGYNFPSQPVIGAFLLMPVGTIGMGLFFSYFYIRTKSIWMPTLAHTSLNLSAGLLYAGMDANIDKVIIPTVFIAVWVIACVGCFMLSKHVHFFYGRWFH